MGDTNESMYEGWYKSRYNIEIIHWNVDTCGRVTVMCIEDDQVWTPTLVSCIDIFVLNQFGFHNKTKTETQF